MPCCRRSHAVSVPMGDLETSTRHFCPPTSQNQQHAMTNSNSITVRCPARLTYLHPGADSDKCCPPHRKWRRRRLRRSQICHNAVRVPQLTCHRTAAFSPFVAWGRRSLHILISNFLRCLFLCSTLTRVSITSKFAQNSTLPRLRQCPIQRCKDDHALFPSKILPLSLTKPKSDPLSINECRQKFTADHRSSKTPSTSFIEKRLVPLRRNIIGRISSGSRSYTRPCYTLFIPLILLSVIALSSSNHAPSSRLQTSNKDDQMKPSQVQMVLNHPSDSKKHEGELEGEIDDEYDELDVYDHHMQTTITDTLELREEEHNHPFVHDPFSEHMHHHEILRRSQNRNVQNTIGHQQQESKMCQIWTKHSPSELCEKKPWARLKLLRKLTIFSDCPSENATLQLGAFFFVDWSLIKSEHDLLSHTEHLRSDARECLLSDKNKMECVACFRRIHRAVEQVDQSSRAFDRVLQQFDCRLAMDLGSATRPFSPNGTCDDCKQWYRKWMLVQFLDLWNERPCISWCYYTQLACPHLAPGKATDYAGHPAFQCRDSYIVAHSTAAAAGGRISEESPCNCFHPCDLDPSTPSLQASALKKTTSKLSSQRQQPYSYSNKFKQDFFQSSEYCASRQQRCSMQKARGGSAGVERPVKIKKNKHGIAT